MPLMEQGAVGNAPIALDNTNGAYTLSLANDASDQARLAFYNFIGTINTATTVTIPPVARIGWASNSTTGGQNVILRAGTTGNSLTIIPGSTYMWSCDGTNVTPVNIGVTGSLSAASGVTMNNGSYIDEKDSTGVIRHVIGLGTDNYVSTFAQGLGWRVLNAAGSTAYMTIAPAGQVSIANTVSISNGDLSVSGKASFGGTLTAGALTLTGGATFGAPVTASGLTSTSNLTVSGAATVGGSLNVTGATSLGNTLAVTGAATVGGALTAGALTLTGNINLNNAAYLSGKDSLGINHLLVGISNDNYVNNFAHGVSWRVLNSAGTVEYFSVAGVNGQVSVNNSLGVAANLSVGGTIGVNGAASFGGTLGVSGAATMGGHLEVGGNALVDGTLTVSGAAAITGNVDFKGALTVESSLQVNTFINVGGQQALSATGYSLSQGGGLVASASAWSFGIAVNTSSGSGMASGGFFTASDRRVKSDIADISPEAGVDWVMRGKPKTYTMDGKTSAGFIAQEDVENGRGAAVSAIPDSRPEVAEGDGMVAPGHRLIRDYNHDIAYLTAAIQYLLAKVDELANK